MSFSRVLCLLLVLLAINGFTTAAASVQVKSVGGRQQQKDGSTSYRATSVMHTPVNIGDGSSVQQILQQNLDMYGAYLSHIEQAEVDIIVFPESGTGFLQVPRPSLRAMCEPLPPVGFVEPNCEVVMNISSWPLHPHASLASCMAQQYSLDLVINYCENTTEPDPNLGPGGTKAFNVNVAFTKDGQLTAMYRKSHIFGSGPFLSEAKPEAVVFNSSFGVRFSMFTCYDLWFLEPMRTAIEELGITDFIFPNEMASATPFFVMPENQAGWSLVHKVNLISSASYGTGGAGLFHMGTAIALNRVVPSGLRNAHSIALGVLPKITPKLLSELAVQEKEVEQDQDVAVAATAKPSSSPNTGTPATCKHGPSFNGLDVPFNCVEFDPNTASSFSLQVKGGGAQKNLNGPIECEAKIQTRGNTTKKWYFGAIEGYITPSVATPSSAVNAMCFIFHCDNATNVCAEATSALDGWSTDLSVQSVSVSGTFGGIYNSTTASVFPHYGFAVGSNTGTPDDFALQIPSRKNLLFQSRTVDEGHAVQYTIAANAFTSPVVKSSFLYSFGILATAKKT